MKLVAYALTYGVVLGSGQFLGAQGAPSTQVTKENLDLPFDAALEAEESEDSPEVVILYGQQYEGNLFVVTGTGSGCPSQASVLGALERELLQRIKELSEKAEFALVLDAHGQPPVKFPRTGGTVPATPANKAAASNFLKSKPAQGQPECLARVLLEGLDSANSSSVKQKVMIYVGGGEGYCGSYGEAAYLQRTLSQVRERNTSNVQIHTIGIGLLEKQREDFLRKLAAMNGGTYTHANP